MWYKVGIREPLVPLEQTRPPPGPISMVAWYPRYVSVGERPHCVPHLPPLPHPLPELYQWEPGTPVTGLWGGRSDCMPQCSHSYIYGSLVLPLQVCGGGRGGGGRLHGSVTPTAISVGAWYSRYMSVGERPDCMPQWPHPPSRAISVGAWYPRYVSVGERPDCVLHLPPPPPPLPELYQWEPSTPVTGLWGRVRLHASVFPQLYLWEPGTPVTGLWGRGQTACLIDPHSYISGSLVPPLQVCGEGPDCMPYWPPQLYQWEPGTPVTGLWGRARLHALLTPTAISVGAWYPRYRSVGERPDCMPYWPPQLYQWEPGTPVTGLWGRARLHALLTPTAISVGAWYPRYRSVGKGQTACLIDPHSYISGSLVPPLQVCGEGPDCMPYWPPQLYQWEPGTPVTGLWGRARLHALLTPTAISVGAWYPRYRSVGERPDCMPYWPPQLYQWEPGTPITGRGGGGGADCMPYWPPQLYQWEPGTPITGPGGGGGGADCMPQWPPQLYQWESGTPVTGLWGRAEGGGGGRLHASVTPTAMSVGVWYPRYMYVGEMPHCVTQWPPKLYQWEPCTPGRSNQAEQVCGEEAGLCASVTPRMHASVTPRAISVGVWYSWQVQPSWTGVWGRGQTVCLSDPPQLYQW